jgi:excisionase family DNA binding protein
MEIEVELEAWVGTRAVAAHLGQTERWVRYYAPVMPHYRVGREYRFKLTEVEAWVEQWRGGTQL